MPNLTLYLTADLSSPDARRGLFDRVRVWVGPGPADPPQPRPPIFRVKRGQPLLSDTMSVGLRVKGADRRPYVPTDATFQMTFSRKRGTTNRVVASPFTTAGGRVKSAFDIELSSAVYQVPDDPHMVISVPAFTPSALAPSQQLPFEFVFALRFTGPDNVVYEMSVDPEIVVEIEN